MIQTFRNAIMAASVLASANLVAFMGILAASSHTEKMVALIIGSILAASASVAILSIITFAKLGFSTQLETSALEHTARRLLFGLRLIQCSALLLVIALMLATALIA